MTDGDVAGGVNAGGCRVVAGRVGVEQRGDVWAIEVEDGA